MYACTGLCTALVHLFCFHTPLVQSLSKTEVASLYLVAFSWFPSIPPFHFYHSQHPMPRHSCSQSSHGYLPPWWLWPCYRFLFYKARAMLCYFFHITDFYRPIEAIMNLAVLIHLNCSCWWYSASIWSVRNGTSKTESPADRRKRQLESGSSLFLSCCLNMFFPHCFRLYCESCWQCRTALHLGQNKKQNNGSLKQ